MKKIKTFNLFESTDYKVRDIIDLYHDIKSIEYILEEEDVDVMMTLRLVRTDRKKSFSVTIRSEESIIDSLRIDPDLEAIDIRISKGKSEWTHESIQEFERLVKRYFNLLKEHLEYIEDDRISFLIYKDDLKKQVKLGIIKIDI